MKLAYSEVLQFATDDLYELESANLLLACNGCLKAVRANNLVTSSSPEGKNVRDRANIIGVRGKKWLPAEVLRVNEEENREEATSNFLVEWKFPPSGDDFAKRNFLAFLSTVERAKLYLPRLFSALLCCPILVSLLSFLAFFYIILSQCWEFPRKSAVCTIDLEVSARFVTVRRQFCLLLPDWNNWWK